MKYKVTGRIYSEKPSFYTWDDSRKWPYYDEVVGTEKVWYIEADSLDEAEKWLAVNHPERYMGGSAVSEDRQSFVMTAVPCEEYGTGNYETLEARKRWCKANF